MILFQLINPKVFHIPGYCFNKVMPGRTKSQVRSFSDNRLFSVYQSLFSVYQNETSADFLCFLWTHKESNKENAPGRTNLPSSSGRELGKSFLQKRVFEYASVLASRQRK